MKFRLSVSAAVFCAMALAVFGSAPVSAQDGGLKIAVVDMQKALNDYYKTEIEVKKINQQADEKRKNLDERQATYQQMTSQMTALDKKVRDTILSDTIRKKAMEELQALAQERAAKAKEIQEAQRKASAELMQARSEMEAALVGEIKTTVNSIVEAQGLDLVFDKSFLPKANKVILYTSDKVKDLTKEVVESLNANAPAKKEN